MAYYESTLCFHWFVYLFFIKSGGSHWVERAFSREWRQRHKQLKTKNLQAIINCYLLRPMDVHNSTSKVFLFYSGLHYSHPIHHVSYDCILCHTVYYVLSTYYVVYLYVLFLLTYMFGLHICLHWGSEWIGTSIQSLSCTYGRTDIKVDFD